VSGGSVTAITQNACIDPHQTGFVGKGSDHLQLIKFWPSRPRGGVCGRMKILGSTLLQPAHSVCISSEHFFHSVLISSSKFINVFVSVK